MESGGTKYTKYNPENLDSLFAMSHHPTHDTFASSSINPSHLSEMPERIESCYDTGKESMSEDTYSEHDKTDIYRTVREIDSIFYHSETRSDENTRENNGAYIGWSCYSYRNKQHEEFDDFFEEAMSSEVCFDKEIAQNTIM